MTMHPVYMAVSISSLILGPCFAQTAKMPSLQPFEANLKADLTTVVQSNDVIRLKTIQGDIAHFSGFISFDSEEDRQRQETACCCYLRLYQATREIKFDEDLYEKYVVRAGNTNTLKPMSHPEVARAIAFPAEESSLITNAVLRRAVDQYRVAQKQREINFYHKRDLEGIRRNVIAHFQWIIKKAPQQTSVRYLERLRSDVVELIPQGSDRDAILALFPKEPEKTAAVEKVR